MKLFSIAGLRLLLVVTAVSVVSSARALDREDLYFNFYGGARFDNRWQMGAAVGYVPLDSLGVGLVVDATLVQTQFSVEPRWFIEPFELASGVGFSRAFDAGPDQYRFLFSLSAAYLWALTPSLALRAELRGQYLLDGTSSALLMVGGRIVF